MNSKPVVKNGKWQYLIPNTQISFKILNTQLLAPIALLHCPRSQPIAHAKAAGRTKDNARAPGDGLASLTGGLRVLDGDDELGALLEALEEVDDEVADVLRVRALEGELLLADRDQRERLRERLAAPEA